MKIEHFSRLEQNYTSAPIAQLAAHLIFFIWFWPDQTWPERVRVQFSLEEHDFFSSFKLIFLSIFCMHLYHILINWSQKFWVVYVEYRFIYEQCVYGNTYHNKDHMCGLPGNVSFFSRRHQWPFVIGLDAYIFLTT